MRMYGTLRRMEDEVSITSYHIRPIASWTEVRINNITLSLRLQTDAFCDLFPFCQLQALTTELILSLWG